MCKTKNGKAFLSAAFLLLLMVPPAFAQSPQPAQSLTDLVGAERAASLVRGGTLSSFQNKNPRPALVPSNDFVKNMADEMIRSLRPSFFVENLSLYRKPPARGRPWTDSERTALYNESLALSSLAGIQYYSASRKEMRTFYETSTVVSGSDGKNPLPDPVYAVPPPQLVVYARQKDLSFGDNVYRYNYYARPESLVFVQENLSSMNYGIIPAVGKNKLRSIVAVLDAEEYLLIYAVSMAKAASLPGMGERVGNSFSTRAEAILGWFKGQADKAFAKTSL
ncbi:MAG: hypothetical protein LBH35_06290 [Treponema sp.]|jgi:hypothetical protein|nr:hypothetical protein [Treponema sp.]